ncbi:MAG: type II/IV secretion system protein [Verrucomicrobia bacterium]|nr:type II/IV secretion system protein [Verrucomicrobiota bacterium]MBT7067862.1 type II/IV secretion system protein [Verrucomicrobiota bacterium]MBT7699865.1 type II/IV secretion system protein [Verrucomicrobiota bacterium]
MPRSIPSHPSVRFLQKEAKDLLKAHKSGDPSCCATLRYHFRFSRASDEDILKAEVSLQEVQHALALDYGFKDWKDLKEDVEATPTVEMVDKGDPDASEVFRSIILDAVAEGATDLHFEPMDHGVRVRRRVDGMLHEADILAEALGQAVIAEGMRSAYMDPNQRSKSQDGRVVIELDDGRIDCRMSSVPSSRGTVLAVRPIDTRTPIFALDRFDFEDDQEERYRALIGSASGVIVVTGPTGAGKTTTLYATLSELNDPSRKIITVEDPVEFLLEGIDQLPVSSDFGFDTALRSVLRQAPNVIMVGEIRDLPTVNIIVQAAMTGHLVLTTLHADTAPGAYSRMTNMGLEPFLVRDTVRGVLAQRLLRRLCPECKEAYEPDAEQVAFLGIDKADAGTLWRATGCEACQHRGYRGRVGVFSLLETNKRVKEAIMTESAAAVEEAIEEAAKSTGWLSLRDAAIRKLLHGETTVEEVIKFT